jgi:hypothetical protein
MHDEERQSRERRHGRIREFVVVTAPAGSLDHTRAAGVTGSVGTHNPFFHDCHVGNSGGVPQKLEERIVEARPCSPLPPAAGSGAMRCWGQTNQQGFWPNVGT